MDAFTIQIKSLGKIMTNTDLIHERLDNRFEAVERHHTPTVLVDEVQDGEYLCTKEIIPFQICDERCDGIVIHTLSDVLAIRSDLLLGDAIAHPLP